MHKMKYGRGARREGRREAGREPRGSRTKLKDTCNCSTYWHTHTETDTHTDYIRSLVFAQIIWVTICRERRVRRGVAGRRWSRAAVLHIGKSKLGNDVDYNDDDKLTRRIRNPRAKPR